MGSLIFFPFRKLFLPFFALEKFSHLREKDPGQGLHFMERDAVYRYPADGANCVIVLWGRRTRLSG